MNLWTIRDYHEQTNRDSTVIKICDAIDDKEHGLGILWVSADFEKWFAELDQYPASWVIGQDRDWLKSYLCHLTTCALDVADRAQK